MMWNDIYCIFNSFVNSPRLPRVSFHAKNSHKKKQCFFLRQAVPGQSYSKLYKLNGLTYLTLQNETMDIVKVHNKKKKKLRMRNIMKHKITKTPPFTQRFSKLLISRRFISIQTVCRMRTTSIHTSSNETLESKDFNLLGPLQSFDKNSTIHIFTLLALITNSDMVAGKSFASTSITPAI